MISGSPNYVRLNGSVENRLLGAGLNAPVWGEAEARDPVGRGLLELIESCIEHVRRACSVTVPIRFVVSRSHKAQAHAFQNDGAPFFAVTEGLIRGLTALARHLALSDWLFVQEPPEAWIPQRPAFAERQAGLLHLFFGHFSLLAEADKARSTLISQTATTFIVMHELGHVVNGHLASGIYATGVISETAEDANLDLALTRRALEYDADAFAVQHTLGVACGLLGRSSVLGPNTNPAELVQLVMIGIAVAQLYFEAFDPGLSQPLSKRTHPPAWVRQYNAMAMFDAIHARDMKTPLWRDLEIRRLNELALLGREIALSDAGVPIIAEALGGGPAARTYLSEFTEAARARWSELRPRLTVAKLGTHNLAL